jgi:hypothetical protein
VIPVNAAHAGMRHYRGMEKPLSSGMGASMPFGPGRTATNYVKSRPEEWRGGDHG